MGDAADATGLSFETVETLDGLEGLAAGWDLLVRGMPRPSPFLLHGWVVEWWRGLGAGGQLRVVAGRRDGRLVAVAPIFVRRRQGIRIARFLGDHESALADLLVAEGEPPSTAVALLREVRTQPFDHVDLFGLPASSTLVETRPAGLSLLERVEAPVLLMPEGWDAVYAARTSSKARNLHRRRLRQLGELGEVTFEVGRTLEELEPLLEEALTLHALRWEGRPDGSSFGTDSGRAFHRAALRRLAGQDVLRLVLMRIGGRPAAFHYFFALEGTMVVHRLAFDPALARLSPGLVATLETLRTASEEGLTRVEFLGGDERYKLDLADRLEPLQQAIGLARTPLGALAARQRLAAIRLRKTLKRSEWLQRLYLSGAIPLHRKRARRTEGTDAVN